MEKKIFFFLLAANLLSTPSSVDTEEEDHEPHGFCLPVIPTGDKWRKNWDLKQRFLGMAHLASRRMKGVQTLYVVGSLSCSEALCPL